MSNPTRATITIATPIVNKGKVTPGPTVHEFEAQFNPKEYSIQKSATWDHKPSTAADKSVMPQFMGANSAELAIELFLDASSFGSDEVSSSKDVVRVAGWLFECCSPLEKTKQQKKPSAPVVILTWGALKFTGNVKQVSVKYTLFDDAGNPLRAVCNVSLQELPTGKGFTNPTSGGREATTSHRVVAGDSLASIAWTEYQDPNMWRQIADANGIDDPLRLPVGAMILVPSPDKPVGASA